MTKIENYDLTRGVTRDGYPFLLLNGYIDEKGIVLGHYTLRTADDVVEFNSTYFMDVVLVLKASNLKESMFLIDKITARFKALPVELHKDFTFDGSDDIVTLIFERIDCDDVFVLSAPQDYKRNSKVFIYDGNLTEYGEVIRSQDLISKAGKDRIIIVLERSCAQKFERQFRSIFQHLILHNDNKVLDNKGYIVAELDVNEESIAILRNDAKAEAPRKTVVAQEDRSTSAYYGDGVYLADGTSKSNVTIEPIEIAGFQNLSKEEFMAFDNSNIYDTIKRFGEYPNDEEGETRFYVNKKGDSFVEVFQSDTNMVYVIKAVDPYFFSKLSIGLNKQESVNLTLLIKSVEVLSTFLTRFSHKEMSFDMRALPDNSVEVRINVGTGWIAQAKNIVRNQLKGDDGYGKTKFEKLKQLKQRRNSKTIATIAATTTGPVAIVKTMAGTARIKLNDLNTWMDKLSEEPKGTVSEITFPEKSTEFDSVVEGLAKEGWLCEYNCENGKHIYSLYQDEATIKSSRRDMKITGLDEISKGESSGYTDSSIFTDKG